MDRHLRILTFIGALIISFVGTIDVVNATNCCCKIIRFEDVGFLSTDWKYYSTKYEWVNTNSCVTKIGFLSGDKYEKRCISPSSCGRSAADVNPKSEVESQITYDRIYFHNKCHKPIRVAINYRNLEGEWVINGFFAFKPKERAWVAKTKNVIYYYYAESQDKVFRWGGDATYGKVNDIRYGFLKGKIPTTEYGEWTQILTCNN